MAIVLTSDLIRSARALLGWSQSELADRSGVSQKSLSDVELGKKPLTLKLSDRLRSVIQENGVEFTARRINGSEITGAGVRWQIEDRNADTIVI